MTPQQKLKWAILLTLATRRKRDLGPITAQNVDQLYDERDNDGSGELQDARNEIRCSGEDTDLPVVHPNYMLSRHYDSKSVAAMMPDGTWVGWIYWYGGGKFGDPDSIDWIDGAYDVDCTEKPVTIIQRSFQVKSSPAVAAA